jgi:hypothetical protein
MKVCIASAHVQCQRVHLWRELQQQFISRCTSWDYEYYVIANGVDPGAFDATGVAHISEKVSHSECIAEILKIWVQSDADFFLLLDSDCWPIRKGWEDLLAGKLGDNHFTAPIRTENLDLFPHPCAVFLPKDHLYDLDFGSERNVNLLGEYVNDVGGALHLEHCFPLLKTNYISPHPVYASIYGDVFYHHCAGSRGAGVRCAGYYRHMISLAQQRKIYDKVTQQLKNDPVSFIDALRGVESREKNAAV